MDGTREKEGDRGERVLATRSAGFPAVAGMCGNVALSRQTAHRSALIDGAELFRQWRLVDFSQGAGGARMVKPCKPSGSRARIDRSRPSGNHTPRIPRRLPAVRSHALPARLRTVQARYAPWVLLAHGIRTGRHQTVSAAQRRRSGPLATCQKIKVGVPATERSGYFSFRHGTRSRSHGTEKSSLRSATERNPLVLGVAAFRHGSPLYITISRPCFSAGEVPTCN